MNELDTAIGRIEQLYHSVTGHEAPVRSETEPPYAPIPPEQDPQRYVGEQFERLAAMLGDRGNAQQQALPAEMSVWETDEDFLVCVDLPGVDRKAVEIAIAGNLMKVTARRTAPVAKKGEARPRWLERHTGNLVRDVVLPRGVERGPFEAHMDNGVLEIHVPKVKVSEASQQVHIT